MAAANPPAPEIILAGIRAVFADALRPDPDLTISEWSDQYRVLSRVSAGEPGRWRTSRTPFLREIMDCLSPSSPYSRVVFMKPAQIGPPPDQIERVIQTSISHFLRQRLIVTCSATWSLSGQACGEMLKVTVFALGFPWRNVTFILT